MTSFVTGPDQEDAIATTIAGTTDPTPATWCRICPERTTDCPLE